MVSEAWPNRRAQSLTAFAAEYSSSMLAFMSRFVLRAIWLTLCPMCQISVLMDSSFSTMGPVSYFFFAVSRSVHVSCASTR